MLRATTEYVTTGHALVFDEREPLRLESGQTLGPISVAYETYGELNSDGTNAILVCHALTASAHAAGYNSPNDRTPGWWNGLVGPGKAFDTEQYFVVCPNILGSCYGTTGPASVNPATGEPYRMSFPFITVRDIVRVQKKLLDMLGVKRLVTVSGSSLGGMQVLECGILYPDFCESIIPISASAKQSAWCIGLNAIARAAITGDPAWNNGFYDEQPARGLALARMVGMVSYRSAAELEQRFGRTRQRGDDSQYDPSNLFEIESYLCYQGEKLVHRFDANAYIVLSRATDSHDVAVGRSEVKDVLGRIRAKTQCIGVSSDIRYPAREQKELVRFIPDARYAEIQSIHGHDAFLIEFDQLNHVISRFLSEVKGA